MGCEHSDIRVCLTDGDAVLRAAEKVVEAWSSDKASAQEQKVLLAVNGKRKKIKGHEENVRVRKPSAAALSSLVSSSSCLHLYLFAFFFLLSGLFFPAWMAKWMDTIGLEAEGRRLKTQFR